MPITTLNVLDCPGASVSSRVSVVPLTVKPSALSRGVIVVSP